MSDQVRQQALAARAASRVLAATSEEERNQALEAIAAALEANRERILAANAEDLKAGEQDGLASPLLKRLDLSGQQIRQHSGDGARRLRPARSPRPDPERDRARRPAPPLPRDRAHWRDRRDL